MDDAVSLTPAQRANLNVLLLLRDAAMHDLGEAACSFGVGRPDLDAVVSLSPDEVIAFVCKIGNQALFRPRDDLRSLLRLPATISPIVASARSVPPRSSGGSQNQS